MAKRNNDNTVEATGLSELAKNYFETHPLYSFDSLYIADDGTIFPGTLKGRNAAENYVAGKLHDGEQMSFTEIFK